MYVKPNRQTPDPDRGGYLAPEGRNVEASPYWLRRIADGDVSECDPPAAAPPPDPSADLPPPAPAHATEPAIAGSSVSGPSSTRNSRKGPQP